jgi:hypothetical protein
MTTDVVRAGALDLERNCSGRESLASGLTIQSTLGMGLVLVIWHFAIPDQSIPALWKLSISPGSLSHLAATYV